MKDHTFDARNDEMRARTKRARNAPTTAPEPGSIEALADATDAAIRAASSKASATKAKKKHPDDVTAKVAKGMKRALAEQEKREDAAKDAAPEPTVADGAKALSELFDRAEREGKPVAKRKVASPAKTIDAAIAADNPLAGAGAASTDVLKAAAKKSRTPRAKVDWLETGLERTGALTVDQLARAWIAHLEQGGKTTASTISSYANDLKTAIPFFGANTAVSTIDRGSLERFNISDGVMKLRSGEPKAMPTILKMRRAFRMALEWARETSVQKS